MISRCPALTLILMFLSTGTAGDTQLTLPYRLVLSIVSHEWKHYEGTDFGWSSKTERREKRTFPIWRKNHTELGISGRTGSTSIRRMFRITGAWRGKGNWWISTPTFYI